MKYTKRILAITFIAVLAFVVSSLISTNQTKQIQASLFIDIKTFVAQEKSRINTLETDLADPGKTVVDCDVVVAGGGSGGTAAALQSARLGVKTCLIEETDWLGGMLTNGGVSAIDGHIETSSGIFKEIKNEIVNYYEKKGMIKETQKCKVSNFCFEPFIGNFIITNMVKNTPNLTYFLNSEVTQVYHQDKKIQGVQFKNNLGQVFVAPAKVTIDATEFGDLMYMAEIPFNLGIDPYSTESLARKVENCIQPLTYVAILKNDSNISGLIPKPKNYNPQNYSCLVDDTNRNESSSNFDANYLLEYGKLPNGKLMINIPSHSCGNDFDATQVYLNVHSREEVLQEAKNHTLGLIYFMQNELGFNSLRIYNEFNTIDGLAKEPYVRESRRLVGVKKLVESDVTPNPKTGRAKLQKNSIAIGDYPIDLHFCTTGIGDVFLPVKPYQIPYEVLIPKEFDGFIAAEKNISVSHIVNGTTRLQPVVMSIGQAAGAAAAISVIDQVEPRSISVKKLQEALVDSGSTIFYFEDLTPEHYAYQEVIALAMQSILQGNPDFTFKPEEIINKDQFLTIIARALDLDLDNDILDELTDQGIQFPETFLDQLDQDLTYQELVDILTTAIIPKLETTVDAQPLPIKNLDPAEAYNENLNELINSKILTKAHQPTNPVSRGEAAVIIYRLLSLTNS